MIKQALIASAMIALVPLAANALQKRDLPPNAAEINEAVARGVDFRDTKVTTARGCVPAGTEGGMVDASFDDWYCEADGTPLPQDSPSIEIVLRRQPGQRKFDVLLGEFAGVCPSAKEIVADVKRFSTMTGVTQLMTDTHPLSGEMTRDGSSVGSVSITCDYPGRIGKNLYQLTLQLTFDQAGYHVRNKVSEDVLDSNGKIVKSAK